MLKEVFIALFLPIILILSPTIILKNYNNKEDIFEKYLLNFGFSTVSATALLIIFGYFYNSGLRLFSHLIFLLGLFLLLIIRGKIFNLVRELKNLIFSFWKTDNYSKVFLLIVSLFLLKILLFCLFKPIIDSDIIYSYLPHARSIFISDNIPEKNYYDETVMMFPPIGGVAIYSWFYNLTGNIFTESFRVLPFFYILGIIVCTYKIAKIIVGDDLAKLSLTLFLIFPFWDDYLFEFIFYPDIIALFLFLAFFFFFQKENYFFDYNKEKRLYYLLISFLLGSTLLFKIQYFISYFFIGLLLCIYILPKKRWAFVFLSFCSLPILFRFKRGIGYQLNNRTQVIVFAILVLLLSFLMLIGKRKTIRIKLTAILIILISLFFGSLIHLRNQYLYGSFLSPINKEAIMTSIVMTRAGISQPSMPLLEWGLFLFPCFAVFWFPIKILGFSESLKQEKARDALLFILIWYTVITLLFPLPNSRSLMPILPFLAILSSLGVDKITSFLKVKTYNFWKFFILISIFFSLFFSTFLWWNGGLIVYGPTNLRKTLTAKTIKAEKTDRKNLYLQPFLPIKDKIPMRAQLGVNKIISKAITIIQTNLNRTLSKITDLSLILTARGEFYQKHFLELIYITAFTSILLIILSYYLMKFSIGLKKLMTIIFFLYFLPYFLVFFILSKGRLWKFKEVEREELYNYWGETNYVIPTILENAKKKSKIVFCGTQTGLSYYTNMKVYNILYSYSLGGILKDIVKETDVKKIYQFYKKNGFEYIVISSYQEFFKKCQKLKTETKIFSILDNQKYTRLILQPNEENFWYVYKLK